MEIRDQAKTSDNVFVQLRIVIKYSIPVDKIERSFYGMKDPENQIKNDVENILRSRVPQTTMEALFTNKDIISDALKKDLSLHLAELGKI